MEIELNMLLKPAADQNAAALKSCCAAVYDSDWLPMLLGNSYHPGKLALTHRLGELLGLNAETRLLDVAAGQGESARYLAETFGCEVIGVDLAAEAVRRAAHLTEGAGLAERVRFEPADAEALPFPDESFDAVLSECAFCTFPAKETAAAEIARVLRPGGQVGISDLTKSGALPEELETVMAWVACVADARPVEDYVTILGSAGLTVARLENHDRALVSLIDEIRGRLLSVELMVRLQKMDLPVAMDFDTAGRLGKLAAETARQGRLGYSLLVGQKNPGQVV